MKRVIAIVLLFFINLPDILAQCSACKAAVESNLENGASKVGMGLNDGILYLMATPYVFMGGLLYFWYRSRVKARERNA